MTSPAIPPSDAEFSSFPASAKMAIAPAFALFLFVGNLVASERLDRGVVAFPTGEDGVYIGWRLLADDPVEVGFDVYRADRADSPASSWAKVNPAPITDSTNFVDRSARGEKSVYAVRPLSNTSEITPFDPARVAERAPVGWLMRIKLQGDYAVARIGVADFDGDGKLDYLVRAPDFNVDPYYRLSNPAVGYWRKSPETPKLEAYRHDGTFLWRHDLGWAIETGTWYAPVVAFDLDGDGKAEVYCKGGPPGDPRDEAGRVTSGPEYLLKLDGQTGKEVARLDWPNREGFTARNGNTTFRLTISTRATSSVSPTWTAGGHTSSSSAARIRRSNSALTALR